MHLLLASAALAEKQLPLDPESIVVREVNKSPLNQEVSEEHLQVIGGGMADDLGGTSR